MKIILTDPGRGVKGIRRAQSLAPNYAEKIGRGDQIRYDGRIWIVEELRDYSGRSAHREIVCALRDA